MQSTASFPIRASAVGNIARLAYAAARRKGADVGQLLTTAGLSREEMNNPDARIGVKEQINFLNLVAEAIGDDLLGFHLALHFDLRMVGLPYYVFASSETLEDAIRNGARCASIINESMRIEVRDGKRRVGFVFEPVGVARHSDRHQIEFWVTAVMRACRSITRRHLTAETVTFAHSQKSAPELNRFFGTRVTFGADADEMTFPASIRDIGVVTADRYLNNLLVHYCDVALAGHRNRGSFGTSVENAVAVLLPHGKARMSEVARKLGQSRRTLARRLASEGSTFAGILRHLRIALAQRYLADEDLTISQISWLLGYRNVSAFTNAYKLWTGHAPRLARQRLR
jgi:AraC-like DNA-binding protein